MKLEHTQQLVRLLPRIRALLSSGINAQRNAQCYTNDASMDDAEIEQLFAEIQEAHKQATSVKQAIDLLESNGYSVKRTPVHIGVAAAAQRQAFDASLAVCGAVSQTKPDYGFKS